MVGFVPREWGSGVVLWGVYSFYFVGMWSNLPCIFRYIGPLWATNIPQRRVGEFVSSWGVQQLDDHAV